jgi:undecaprenyl-diphosphatase
MSYDRHLERWVVHHRAGWLNPIFEALSWVGGEGLIWLALGLVLAAIWRRPFVFVQVAFADAAADLLAYGLRALIDRPRPPAVYQEPKPLVHVPLGGSFPSGHAATSFACATMLSLIVPRYTVAFFLLAAAIAWSRVYNGVHYPLDVLGGAALGVVVAIALRWLLKALPRSRRARPAG